MEKRHKNCQSCGMPLSKSPNGGGSEADGSISPKYCAHCYEDGRFKQPDISAQDMQSFVLAKMKEMGFPGFIAKLFVRQIPKLERWRQAS